MTGRKRVASSKSKPKISKTTKHTKPIVSSTIRHPQNNVKIFNVKRSDYLSYDDLKSMRGKVNELATLNCEDEETNPIDITDTTEEFMQDFEENYSGIISIATLFCTINKLFEDVGWKFSNYNKLDGSKCELTNLITKQKFRINVLFDEGYEADIKKHIMKKKSEKPKYFHVYDNEESKQLCMSNDGGIKNDVKGKGKAVDLETNMVDVKIINGDHDDDGKLQTYSAARTRTKRNLPGLQEEIIIFLEEVTDEIRNRVVHFEDPSFLLKTYDSQKSNNDSNSTNNDNDYGGDKEYLMREYEEIEKNIYRFVPVEGINGDLVIGEFKSTANDACNANAIDKAKNVSTSIIYNLVNNNKAVTSTTHAKAPTAFSKSNDDCRSEGSTNKNHDHSIVVRDSRVVDDVSVTNAFDNNVVLKDLKVAVKSKAIPTRNKSIESAGGIIKPNLLTNNKLIFDIDEMIIDN